MRNSSPTTLERQSDPKIGHTLRALSISIALGVVSCIQADHTPPALPLKVGTEALDHDTTLIEDSLFVSLISVSAEIQASMNTSTDNHSLQFVWETVSQHLQAQHIKDAVSVSLCTPQGTERGFAYILIDVAGQQVQIFAKDKKTAESTIKNIQTTYIIHAKNRITSLLGESSATREKLQIILEDEKEGLEKHHMIAIVREEGENDWAISFKTEI